MTAPADRCPCDLRGWYISDLTIGLLLIAGAALLAVFEADWVASAAGGAMGIIFLVLGLPSLVRIKRNHEAGSCTRGGRS